MSSSHLVNLSLLQHNKHCFAICHNYIVILYSTLIAGFSSLLNFAFFYILYIILRHFPIFYTLRLSGCSRTSIPLKESWFWKLAMCIYTNLWNVLPFKKIFYLWLIFKKPPIPICQIWFILSRMKEEEQLTS